MQEAAHLEVLGNLKASYPWVPSMQQGLGVGWYSLTGDALIYDV